MRLNRSIALTALIATALVPGLAQAACTQQEASAKSLQLGQIVQAKMAKDPAAGQALMMKMQPIMQAYQGQMISGGAVDWNAVCSQYDAMIEQAK